MFSIELDLIPFAPNQSSDLIRTRVRIVVDRIKADISMCDLVEAIGLPLAVRYDPRASSRMGEVNALIANRPEGGQWRNGKHISEQMNHGAAPTCMKRRAAALGVA